MLSQLRSTVMHLPRSRSGWWAVGLTTAFVGLFIINVLIFVPAAEGESSIDWVVALLPFYGILMMLCGLAGAVVGLIAILRSRDYSWMVWVTLLPGLFVILLIAGEFLFPH